MSDEGVLALGLRSTKVTLLMNPGLPAPLPRVMVMVEQASTFQHLFRTQAVRALQAEGVEVVALCLPGCGLDEAARAAHPGLREHEVNFKQRGGWKKLTRLLDKLAHVLERDLLILDAPDDTLAQDRRFYQRRRGTHPGLRILYARFLHACGLRWRHISRWAERWGSYPTLGELLDRERPIAIIYCNFMVGQFDCLKEARRRGIRLILDVPNWDQATTKGPISVMPDRVLLWSEEVARDFCRIQTFAVERTRQVGCVNFDLYFDPPPVVPREEFCLRYQIDPGARILLYAYGRLDGYDMFDPIVEELYDLVRDGRLGFPVHLLVRASPSVPLPPERGVRSGLSYQKPLARQRAGSMQWIPDPEEECERFSTIYHSEVCVNNLSTMILDAGAVGRPVINMGYVIENGEAYPHGVDRFLRYTHLRILQRTGATALPRDREQLREKLLEFFNTPQSNLQARGQLLKDVCGFTDGLSHRRWAEAVAGWSGEVQDQEE